MTNLRNGLALSRFGSLDVQLAALRADIDELARSFSDEYDEDSEPVQRAEQLSAAIQRLEWALERQRHRRRFATAVA